MGLFVISECIEKPFGVWEAHSAPHPLRVGSSKKGKEGMREMMEGRESERKEERTGGREGGRTPQDLAASMLTCITFLFYCF